MIPRPTKHLPCDAEGSVSLQQAIRAAEDKPDKDEKADLASGSASSSLVLGSASTENMSQFLNILKLKRPRWKRSRWYRLAYVLASINLVTIIVSLAAMHSLLNSYEHSIMSNQVWTQRIIQFAKLTDLAYAVNFPANDVFRTNDIEKEAANLAKGVRDYLAESRVIRKTLPLKTSPEDAQPTPSVDPVAAKNGDFSPLDCIAKAILAQRGRYQILCAFAQRARGRRRIWRGLLRCPNGRDLDARLGANGVGQFSGDIDDDFVENVMANVLTLHLVQFKGKRGP